MKTKLTAIDDEAEVMKQIDQKLKNLSPDIRKEAFQVLVERHLGSAPSRRQKKKALSSEAGRKKIRTKKASAVLMVVKDLPLKKDGKIPSLRDFYAEKKPQGFLEHNTLFVYYLNKMRDIPGITQSHVYTCYKEVAARIPGAFYQSLVDTARRKGWIDTSEGDDMRVTTVGENFVEHDLPGKASE